MKKLTPVQITLIVIGIILLLTIVWVIGAYNGLIKADESVNEKWANVQTAYQRRADLIPNLVEVVKSYRNYEQETLTQITALRSQAGQTRLDVSSATTPAQLQAASAQMDSVLSRLLVIVENYPDLKASENYLSLQDELAGTENRIKTERDIFNNAVKDYNIKVRRFPTNIIAGMFNFETKTMFEAEAGAEKAPEVGSMI